MAGVMKLAGKIPPDALEKMPAGIRGNLTLLGAGELITAIFLIVPLTSSLGVLLMSGFWGGVISFHMAHGESSALRRDVAAHLGRGLPPRPGRVLQLHEVPSEGTRDRGDRGLRSGHRRACFRATRDRPVRVAGCAPAGGVAYAKASFHFRKGFSKQTQLGVRRPSTARTPRRA